MTSAELGEWTGLVTVQLVNNMNVVCRGEKLVDLVCLFMAWGCKPFTFPS